METEDLNEWITWFSNVIRKLNEEERSVFIEQIRKGSQTVENPSHFLKYAVDNCRPQW